MTVRARGCERRISILGCVGKGASACVFILSASRSIFSIPGILGILSVLGILCNLGILGTFAVLGTLGLGILCILGILGILSILGTLDLSTLKRIYAVSKCLKPPLA